MEFANTQKVLNEYAQRLIEKYRDNLTADNSKASGNLYNNITYKVNTGTERLEIVLTLEDYWKYVEDGRRAGAKMPPIAAIEKWIEVKPIIPSVGKNGKVPTVRQLAYLIARSIGIKGIPAKRPLRKAYKSIEEELFAELEKAIASDAKNYILLAIRMKRAK